MAPKTDPGLDPATERVVAVALFNHAWTLMEVADRTEEQECELVHAAHASAYHWMKVGNAVNRARSEWQCSRVYAVLGRAEPALWHARRCLGFCEREGIGDWDLAFAYEALASAATRRGRRQGPERGRRDRRGRRQGARPQRPRNDPGGRLTVRPARAWE